MRNTGTSPGISTTNAPILTPERYGISPGTVSASTSQLENSGHNENVQNVNTALSQSTDSSLLDW